MAKWGRAIAWSLALACLAASPAAAQSIEILGSKVPIQALGFGSLGGAVTPVTAGTPLPMICISGCSATGAGTATGAAPTRVEGQSYGLSFDLNGALRVTGGGGGGGSGTEFAEDAAHVTGALGTLALGVRKDTAASLAGTDGDYTGSIYDSTGRLWVNPGTVAVTGTFWQATQPVSAASLPLPTGASSAANQATANASLAAIDADLGQQGDNACTTDAGACSLFALVKRTNEKLEAIRTATDPVAVTKSGAWDMALAAAATGGCTPYGYQSAASNNASSIKAGAGTLCSLNIINTTANLYYLRLYNLAAAPTCSSATGFVKTIPIPASATGAGVALDLGAYGEAYAAGLAFCLTGGGSSTDNTNAATGVYVSASYK